ncbi:hypothetical protein Tco_1372276 [Tanacetum coccineum]
MADENVPALAPTRSDDQILPFAAWVLIGKSNFVLDLQNKQKNLIFQISVDILQNTNFFRAFTTSASVLTIYIQQFWNMITYEAKTRAYKITHIDQAHQFVSPPSGDVIMDFVKELGYTEEIHFVSRMAVNNLNAPYYNAYMEMVAKHDQKMAVEKGGKKKPATAKKLKPKAAKEKSSKPAPAPKPKVTKEKSSKPSPTKHPKRGKVQKLRKGKTPLQLIDEDEPTQPEPKLEPEPEHHGEGEEYDVERAIQMSLESFQAQSKGKAIATEEQAAQSLLALHTPKRRSTTDQFIFQRRALATEEASTGPSAQPQDDASANIVRDSPSPADAETGADTNKKNSGGDTEILQIGEVQSDDVANVVNLEEKTVEIDEGQAGSDPGKTPESRPPPDEDKMDEDQAGPDPRERRVALARPNCNTPIFTYSSES